MEAERDGIVEGLSKWEGWWLGHPSSTALAAMSSSAVLPSGESFALRSLMNASPGPPASTFPGPTDRCRVSRSASHTTLLSSSASWFALMSASKAASVTALRSKGGMAEGEKSGVRKWRTCVQDTFEEARARALLGERRVVMSGGEEGVVATGRSDLGGVSMEEWIKNEMYPAPINGSGEVGFGWLFSVA